MKLRIRGNSIRLRLLKSEVTELVGSGECSESTDFGGGSHLVYSISMQGSQTVADFRDGNLTVYVPESELREWADSDEKIGIEAETNGLKILIEKDFACPTRKNDPDNLDAFANPEAVCT